MARRLRTAVCCALALLIAVAFCSAGCGKKVGTADKEPTSQDFNKKAQALEKAGMQKNWMGKKGQ